MISHPNGIFVEIFSFGNIFPTRFAPYFPELRGFHGHTNIMCERYYALRRLRPLSRRLLRTDRPDLVDIHNLNPCLRERLRLLGWNVRFVDMSTSWLFFQSTLLVGPCILSTAVNFHQL